MCPVFGPRGDLVSCSLSVCRDLAGLLTSKQHAAMEPCYYQVATFARKPRAGRALLCLAVLCFGQLCFVQGWPAPIKDRIWTSKIQCFVREEKRGAAYKIKSSQTVGELLDFVDAVVDKPVFDHIHVAATYTKLNDFQKKGELPVMSYEY